MNDEENRNATWGDFIILLLTLSVLSVAAAVVLIVVNRRSEKRPLSRTKVELEWEDRDEAVQEYTPLSVDFNAKNPIRRVFTDSAE